MCHPGQSTKFYFCLVSYFLCMYGPYHQFLLNSQEQEIRWHLYVDTVVKGYDERSGN